MGHYPGQATAQPAGEFEQQVAVGMDPAALLAAVDFDQRRGGAGWAAIMSAMSGSSVITMI